MAADHNKKGFCVSWLASPACKGNMMGEPAYVLIVHSSDPTCGRGDNYEVEVYISGVGDVDYLAGNRGLAAAKLYVSIPAYIPKTIKMDPEDERIRLTVKSTYLEYTEIKSSVDRKSILRENLHPSVFDITVPHYFFTRKLRNVDPNDLGVEGESPLWNKEWWQDNYYYAPLYLSFTVANNAPSGDHNIYLHLVYRDCLRWYSSSATLKIHIKQWYENDGTRFLVMLAAIASIISGLWALCNCFNGLPTGVRSITTIIAPIILILGLWGLYIFVARD